jgi:hypothetical protein
MSYFAKNVLAGETAWARRRGALLDRGEGLNQRGQHDQVDIGKEALVDRRSRRLNQY